MNRLGAFLAAGVTACASAPAQRIEEPETSIITTSTGEYVRLKGSASEVTDQVPLAPNRTWVLLPEVYRELGLGGRIIDEAALIYGNDRVSASRINNKLVSDYFRCGNEGAGPSAVSRRRVHFQIATQIVKALGDGTELLTRINASGEPLEGTSNSRVLCVSNGALEREIMNRLRQRQ